MENFIFCAVFYRHADAVVRIVSRISGHNSLSEPPENTSKNFWGGIFKAYKMGTLTRNGLITIFTSLH